VWTALSLDCFTKYVLRLCPVVPNTIIIRIEGGHAPHNVKTVPLIRGLAGHRLKADLLCLILFNGCLAGCAGSPVPLLLHHMRAGIMCSDGIQRHHAKASGPAASQPARRCWHNPGYKVNDLSMLQPVILPYTCFAKLRATLLLFVVLPYRCFAMLRAAMLHSPVLPYTCCALLRATMLHFAVLPYTCCDLLRATLSCTLLHCHTHAAPCWGQQ
jgi:hypothetical protein